MPRPRVEIDAKRVLALASNHCTPEEIAADQNCSAMTIRRRFEHLLARGAELAKLSIRAKQFQLAMGRPAEPAEYLRDGSGNLVLNKKGDPIKTKAEVKAIPPNPMMLKWLGQQYLRQSERFEMTEGDGFEFTS